MELGADALGFVFDRTSSRCVAERRETLDLITRLSPLINCIAVYGDLVPNPDDWRCNLRQFSGGDKVWGPHIRAFRFKDGTKAEEATRDIRSYASEMLPKAILIDGFHPTLSGGSGATADWDLSASVVQGLPEHNVILAGGLTPDNVAEAIRIVKPYAVDVSSGVESSPGVKDPVKLRDFIQAARSA